jgi:signal transduction histidine kinase
MSAPAISLTPDRDIYQEYERKRRLRLVSILLPILAALQFTVAFASAALALRVRYAPPFELLYNLNTAIVTLDALVNVLGIRYARQGRVGLATFCVIAPGTLTMMGPALSYTIVLRATPVANSPLVPIALSVVIGSSMLIMLGGLLIPSRVFVIASALLMNAFVLYLMSSILSAPGIGPAMKNSALLLMVFPILVHWAVAGVLFAAGGTYVQTLRELGDVRVAYERAQQVDHLKDLFVTHVNHELRSPVMALQGHVELLLLAEPTLTPQERHTYLERAKRAGDQLVALVTSILAVRRMEQEIDRFMPEAVAVRDALDAAIQMIDPRDGQHVERALRVHIPANLLVWGEPVRIRQIFTNLLSNALKYSPPGTPIDVEAHLAAEEPAQRGGRARGRTPARPVVEITVRDHGLGIPAEQLPLLFKRFVRLPRDLASNVPGNGLGLYLCQAYAEAMGGTIWVESTGVEGEGSTFHLRLPLPPAAAELDALHVGGPHTETDRREEAARRHVTSPPARLDDSFPVESS